MLLVALGLLLPAAAAATDRQATPDPDRYAPPEGVRTERLIKYTIKWTELPRSVDTVALTRVTLSPGATTVEWNTHLFVVESGALTVQEYAHLLLTGTPEPFQEGGSVVPAGPPVTHEAGDQFLVTPDVPQPPTITNEGTEPAVALVVALAVTGGNGLHIFSRGWSVVEPLAAEEAARVAPFLLDATPLTVSAVALVRVRYDRGASFDIVGPAARLLAVESGALNVQVDDAALYRPAGAAPEQLPPTARVSLVPGDQLLVPGPGTIATRNVARGPSAALVVTVSQVYTAGPDQAATVQR